MMKILLVSSALCGVALAEAAQAATYVEKDTVTLRALDKITGRSTDIQLTVGDDVVFGSLKVELKTCYQTPPEEAPESAALLKISSTQPVAVETMEAAISADDVETVSEENPELFSGWMFASSPGLSALEHPVYDVWVIRCSAHAPVNFEAPAAPSGDDLVFEDDTAPVTDTAPEGVPEDVPVPETVAPTPEVEPVEAVTPEAETETSEDPLDALFGPEPQ